MLGAAVGLLIFLHFTKILLPAESLAIKSLRPIFSKFYSASSYFRNTYNAQADKRDLADENKKLLEQINDLIVKNSRLEELENENDTLRSHLNFLKESQAGYVMSNIISSGVFNVSGSGQIFVINKGKKDGFKNGLAVVSSQGIIVGKIINTKDNISEVCLTTSQKCKLAATIQNQDKTTGIAEGDFGLTIKMWFIPQTKEIKIGDTVITSGLEENIPRGLVIGAVSKVNKENNELWQTATIEPMLDLESLTIVSVLLP